MPEGWLERKRDQVRDVRCAARRIQQSEGKCVDREGPEDLRRVWAGLRCKANGFRRDR